MIDETEEQDSGRFTVESTDPEGAKKYDGVVRDVLSDLNLARAIERLHVYIDPKQPVFIAVGTFRRSLPTLTLGDVADIASINEGLMVSVRDEQYAATAVGKLYLKYGRDQLIPTDRTSVIVPHSGDFANQYDDIASIVVYDPKDELKKSVIDALIRITPEGFRVRKHYISEHALAFIASEDPIKPEWTDICRKLREKIDKEEAD
jgi:putative methanogenesis marker protein 17